MMRTLSIALLSLAFAAGCSKKDDKKADPAKTETAPKATDPATTPTTPTTPTATDPAAAGTPATTDTTAPAAGGSMDKAKVEAMMNEMSGIFEKNAKDCDKLGEDLKAYVEKNKDALKASQEWEKSLPDAEKKAWKDQGKAQMEKHTETIKACMSNAKVGEAFKAMAEVQTSN